MALFTDGPPSTFEDLTAHDSQLMNVASTEGIDVTKKLALAYEQAGIEIAALLGRYLTAPRMEQIVITPLMRLWHSYLTLESVYSDAFHSELNDRYAAKRDQFGERAKWAYEKLMETGIGMTLEPVARAATPNVTPAPGLLADGSYFVTMSWVNRSGEEGAAANPTCISVAGCSFGVDPGDAPEGAAGWNIYAGTSPEAMYRQNGTPAGIGERWLQPGALAVGGATPAAGQPVNLMFQTSRLLQRG